MDPSDEIFYQAAVPIPDEEQSEQDIVTLWPEQPSEKFLCEVSTQFSDEEQDNYMAADEVPASLLQPL